MNEQQYEFGMIGLGTMGQNLVLNMGDHGFSVAGYDKDEKQVDLFNKINEKPTLHAFNKLENFMQSLKSPRIILMLVPAGKIVDAVIRDLRPYLNAEDLLMDCGNSHFNDTDIRIASLATEGIHFMGTGVSGGETGARIGPSIMPGGSASGYEKVAPMLMAISAKVNEEPCVTYSGKGSAGHYVKMVHNGIEYAMMQLISECYHILKKIGGLDNDGLHQAFTNYNQTEIRSYLIEITAAIFTQKDGLSDAYLVDKILDKAYQKGTGAWTSQDAMNLQVPIPAIDAAVSQREMSTIKEQRFAAAGVIKMNDLKTDPQPRLVDMIRDTLHFGMITIYAQGFSLLKEASLKYDYNIKVADISSIWRGGCIIRSSMLNDISNAYTQNPSTINLMLYSKFSEQLAMLQTQIRSVIIDAVNSGIPVPGMVSCLSYFDSYRSEWLPANLIQAQRDFFGAHTYERNDRAGIFHTEWDEKIN